MLQPPGLRMRRPPRWPRNRPTTRSCGATGAEALDQTPPPRRRGDDSASSCLQVVVQEALERLSPQHRRVVELRIEGHEVNEIARKTERSKRTVERVLQEARQQLRDLLPQ